MGVGLIGTAGRMLRPLWWAGMVALLSSCSLLPTTAPEPELLPGPPVEHFQISGRAMLRHQQRLDHFRFDWSHDPRRDELMITSPFGQGLAQIVSTETRAELRWPEGRTEQAANLPTLASQLFGQPIPLGELSEWLRGARAQRSGQIDGWQITVESIRRVSGAADSKDSSHVLPKTLNIRRDDTLLRLVVDDQEATQ